MKTPRIFFTILAGFAMMSVCASAQSILVSSNNFSLSYGVNTAFNQAKFGFGVYTYNGSDFLFNSIRFNNQDVGNIYTISSQQDDPNFNLNVNALSNPNNGPLAYVLGAPDGTGETGSVTEAQLFNGLNGAAPGLPGFQIQSFSFQIDSLSIQSPGSDPNHNGNWTDYSGQVTFLIYATPIPEPGTLSLLGVAALFLAIVFRARLSSRKKISSRNLR